MMPSISELCKIAPMNFYSRIYIINELLKVMDKAVFDFINKATLQNNVTRVLKGYNLCLTYLVEDFLIDYFKNRFRLKLYT